MYNLSSGAGAVYRQCDITEPEEVRKLVAGIMKEYGRIDLVIQGGGGIVARSVIDFTQTEDFTGGVKSKALGTLGS